MSREQGSHWCDNVYAKTTALHGKVNLSLCNKRQQPGLKVPTVLKEADFGPIVDRIRQSCSSDPAYSVLLAIKLCALA